MLPKKITYVDYDGVERTETFYFNMTTAELTMYQLEHAGGMKKHLEKIVEGQDQPAILERFRDIIHRAYGEKSEDGRRFIKSDELSTAFEQTEAYSVLVMELLTDEKAAADFINGVMPQKYRDAKRVQKPNGDANLLGAKTE